jgi:hypothetical protein
MPVRMLQQTVHREIAAFHTELSKLRASRTGTDVRLEWITLSEVGNRGFEVQRASSESRGWQQVGFVPGGADGQFTRDYSIVDRRVPPEDLRYMLRIIGDDGMIQYSQIITVPVSGILHSFVVNAVAENSRTAANVVVDLLREDIVSLQFNDMRGNVIEHLAARKKLPIGKHDFAVDCSSLPRGKYEFLLFTSEGQYRRNYEVQR